MKCKSLSIYGSRRPKYFANKKFKFVQGNECTQNNIDDNNNNITMNMMMMIIIIIAVMMMMIIIIIIIIIIPERVVIKWVKKNKMHFKWHGRMIIYIYIYIYKWICMYVWYNSSFLPFLYILINILSKLLHAFRYFFCIFQYLPTWM